MRVRLALGLKGLKDLRPVHVQVAVLRQGILPDEAFEVVGVAEHAHDVVGAAPNVVVVGLTSSDSNALSMASASAKLSPSRLSVVSTESSGFGIGVPFCSFGLNCRLF